MKMTSNATKTQNRKSERRRKKGNLQLSYAVIRQKSKQLCLKPLGEKLSLHNIHC